MDSMFAVLRRVCLLTSMLFAVGALAQSPAVSQATKPIQAVAVEDLAPDAAVELFKTLPAPTMAEMNGEFSAEMMSFAPLYSRLLWGIATSNPIYLGVWQGKSFHQTGPNEGRGYNTVWRLIVGKVDLWPMLTKIGPSYFDGKPSFQLIYRAFDHHAGDIHMLDEVRRLPDGRYLGIGRIGSTPEERAQIKPFLFKARIGDYRQDVGTPRTDFDMDRELELLGFPPTANEQAVKQSEKRSSP